MSTTKHHGGNVNTNHVPTPQQEIILDIFRDEYTTSPSYIRKKTGIRRQRVHQLLDILTSAGWVYKHAHGLYRLQYDGHGFVTHTIHYTDEDVAPETTLTKEMDDAGIGKGTDAGSESESESDSQ